MVSGFWIIIYSVAPGEGEWEEKMLKIWGEAFFWMGVVAQSVWNTGSSQSVDLGLTHNILSLGNRKHVFKMVAS